MGEENEEEFTPSKLKERMDSIETKISEVPGQIADAVKSALEPFTNAPTKDSGEGNQGEPSGTTEPTPPSEPKKRWGAWWGDSHS